MRLPHGIDWTSRSVKKKPGSLGSPCHRVHWIIRIMESLGPPSHQVHRVTSSQGPPTQLVIHRGSKTTGQQFSWFTELPVRQVAASTKHQVHRFNGSTEIWFTESLRQRVTWSSESMGPPSCQVHWVCRSPWYWVMWRASNKGPPRLPWQLTVTSLKMEREIYTSSNPHTGNCYWACWERLNANFMGRSDAGGSSSDARASYHRVSINIHCHGLAGQLPAVTV